MLPSHLPLAVVMLATLTHGPTTYAASQQVLQNAMLVVAPLGDPVLSNTCGHDFVNLTAIRI